MNRVKKIFALLFAIMAVMLMSTAAFAEEEYWLWIAGTQVTSENAGNILGNGVFSYDVDNKRLTVNGTCESPNTVIHNTGIPDLEIYIEGESILKSTSDNATYGAAIYSERDITITGPGKLTVTTTVEKNSAGVQLGYGANLTIKDANLSLDIKNKYGIGSFNYMGTLNIINSNVDIYAHRESSAAFAINEFERIELHDCKVTYPNGGILKNASIYESDGKTAAQKVTISRSAGDNAASIYSTYNIEVAKVAVTSENADDILGDGAAEYDPAANILYIRGDISVDYGDAILNNIDDLTIKVEKDSTIEGNISLLRNTVIKGLYKLTVSGNLYVTNSHTFTFDNATVEIIGDNYGIYEGSLSEKFVFKNSDVTFEGRKSAIYSANSESTFTFTDCSITTPTGAVVKNGNIYESDGTTLAQKEVITHQKERIEDYELYIGNTQVTNKNKDDILKNDIFSYDDQKKTLYIKGDYYYYSTSSSLPLIDNKGIKGLIIDIVEDSTLTARGCIYGIRTAGQTTITGDGKLTLNVDGATNIQYYAIYAPASLTIENAEMEITGKDAAIYASNSPLYVSKSLVSAHKTSNTRDFSAVYSESANIIFNDDKLINAQLGDNLYLGNTIYESDGTTPASDVVIAQYTVSFNKNGGTGTMDDIPAKNGKSILVPECKFDSPSGKKFVGWKTGGAVFRPGENYEVSDDTIFFAQWESNYWTVGFQDLTGTNADYPVYIAKGEQYTLPNASFFTAPTGKQFSCWKIGYDTYNVGKVIDVTENINIYAVWETKECIVTFDTNGIGTAPDKQNVQYGNKATSPVVDAVNGYFVSAWYADKECTEVFDFDTVIKDDITLYAKWEEAGNKITVDGNEKTVMIYFGDDIEFEFSDSTAPTDNYYKLWFTYIPKGETKTTTKLIKGNLPVVYSSTDENYSVILNPSNTSIIAKLGAGLYATNANAVPINLIVKYKQGDLNKNGSLDEEDAAIMLKYISGSIQLDETQLEIADANSDGRKDMLDVIAILNMAS